jgi:hypothetical protein
MYIIPFNSYNILKFHHDFWNTLYFFFHRCFNSSDKRLCVNKRSSGTGGRNAIRKFKCQVHLQLNQNPYKFYAQTAPHDEAWSKHFVN